MKGANGMDCCDFCDVHMDDHAFLELEIDFGKLGRGYVYVSIEEEGKLEIAFTQGFDNSVLAKDIPIKYCPMCGRKMGVTG